MTLPSHIVRPEQRVGLVRVCDAFGNQVDVLLGIRGLDPKAFSRTIEVPLEGTRLRFVGREDFIAMKVAAGSPIELLDAENAIAAFAEADVASAPVARPLSIASFRQVHLS